MEALDAARSALAVSLRGGRLTARACSLATSGGGALFAGEAASVDLDDVAVRGLGAVEVAVLGGASTLSAHGLLIEGGAWSGLDVSEGSTARLDGVLARGLTGALDASYRSGAVLVQRGAHLDARELVIEGVAPAGLALRDAQTTATVDGMMVRDVRADFGSGRCVDVNDSARATLRRVTLRRCHDAGLQVAEFARVDLRDAAIREVSARGDGLFGFGVTVLSLGHLDARRVLIAGSAMGGIGAIGLPEELLTRAGLADALRPFG